MLGVWGPGGWQRQSPSSEARQQDPRHGARPAGHQRGERAPLLWLLALPCVSNVAVSHSASFACVAPHASSYIHFIAIFVRRASGCLLANRLICLVPSKC